MATQPPAASHQSIFGFRWRGKKKKKSLLPNSWGDGGGRRLQRPSSPGRAPKREGRSHRSIPSARERCGTPGPPSPAGAAPSSCSANPPHRRTSRHRPLCKAPPCNRVAGDRFLARAGFGPGRRACQFSAALVAFIVGLIKDIAVPASPASSYSPSDFMLHPCCSTARATVKPSRSWLGG